MELVHRDVLLICVQDVHHQVGVVSAVAPARKSQLPLQISCIDFVCIFFTFDSHKRVWALILQSLPCNPVSFTAFLFIITSTGCRRPPVLTSMLVLSYTTPVGFSALLLRFMLLLSVSCGTASTNVLSASAAAAAFFLSI